MCKAGKFNLSYDSLTSHEARQALRDLPNTKPTFFAEISQPRSRSEHAVPVLNEHQIQQEDSEILYGGPDAFDDSDVPLPEVAAHQDEIVAQFGQANFDRTQAVEDLEHTYVAFENHGLSSAAEAEDVLVESVDAHVTDVSGAFTGRPKRKCRANVLYASKNWLDSDEINV